LEANKNEGCQFQQYDDSSGGCKERGVHECFDFIFISHSNKYISFNIKKNTIEHSIKLILGFQALILDD
jgi:hypothetical protein